MEDEPEICWTAKSIFKYIYERVVCYMNSLLQQLYMIPLFRKGILELELDYKEEPASISMDLPRYLKLIFNALKIPKKKSYNASHLCRLIKDYNDRPLSIYEQRDADEFYNLLMDRLEDCLKNTERPNLIKEVFGGKLSNEVICIDCPHSQINFKSLQSKKIAVELVLLSGYRTQVQLNSVAQIKIS